MRITPEFFENAACRPSSMARFRAVWPPTVGRDGKSGAGAKSSRLDAENLCQIFAGQRLDVGTVGDLRIGHDGGPDWSSPAPLSYPSDLRALARLGAGVVELRRLANDNGGQSR